MYICKFGLSEGAHVSKGCANDIDRSFKTGVNMPDNGNIIIKGAKGKRIGTQTGDTWETKKAVAAKEKIRKHSKCFGGTLTNKEVWELAKISKMTFYKYLKELQQEQ